MHHLRVVNGPFTIGKWLVFGVKICALYPPDWSLSEQKRAVFIAHFSYFLHNKHIYSDLKLHAQNWRFFEHEHSWWISREFWEHVCKDVSNILTFAREMLMNVSMSVGHRPYIILSAELKRDIIGCVIPSKSTLLFPSVVERYFRSDEEHNNPQRKNICKLEWTKLFLLLLQSRTYKTPT